MARRDDTQKGSSLVVPRPAAAVPIESSSGRWILSAYGCHEAISARERVGGACAIVFCSAAVEPRELDLRLRQILTGAPPADAPALGPVPPAVQHVARALLAWQAELENDSGAPCFWGLALVDSAENPAIAYLGEAAPVLNSGERDLPVSWRTLRGANGDTIHAATLRPGQSHELSLRWRTRQDARQRPLGTVEGRWTVVETTDERMDERAEARSENHPEERLEPRTESPHNDRATLGTTPSSAQDSHVARDEPEAAGNASSATNTPAAPRAPSDPSPDRIAIERTLHEVLGLAGEDPELDSLSAPPADPEALPIGYTGPALEPDPVDALPLIGVPHETSRGLGATPGARDDARREETVARPQQEERASFAMDDDRVANTHVPSHDEATARSVPTVGASSATPQPTPHDRSHAIVDASSPARVDETPRPLAELSSTTRVAIPGDAVPHEYDEIFQPRPDARRQNESLLDLELAAVLAPWTARLAPATRVTKEWLGVARAALASGARVTLERLRHLPQPSAELTRGALERIHDVPRPDEESLAATRAALRRSADALVESLRNARERARHLPRPAGDSLRRTLERLRSTARNRAAAATSIPSPQVAGEAAEQAAVSQETRPTPTIAIESPAPPHEHTPPPVMAEGPPQTPVSGVVSRTAAETKPAANAPAQTPTSATSKPQPMTTGGTRPSTTRGPQTTPAGTPRQMPTPTTRKTSPATSRTAPPATARTAAGSQRNPGATKGVPARPRVVSQEPAWRMPRHERLGSHPTPRPGDLPAAIVAALRSQITSRGPARASSPRPAAPALPASFAAALRGPSRPRRFRFDRAGRTAAIGAIPLLALAIGWAIGNFHTDDSSTVSTLGPWQRMLNSIGFGASYVCMLSSSPSGVQVAVDDKPLDRATPLNLELTPGEHRITLGMPHLGSATYQIYGTAREITWMAPVLTGSLQIGLGGVSGSCLVSIDGVPYGVVPARIDRLPPGPHQLQFTKTGRGTWRQSVDVRIGTLTHVYLTPSTSD